VTAVLRRRTRLAPLVVAGAVSALVLTSCASADDSSADGGSGSSASATAKTLPQDLVDAATAAATEAAGGEELTGSLTILGVTGGAEGDDLVAAMKPFEDATGVTIDYTGSQDQASVLAAGIQAGNAPDIIDAQGAGLAIQYAQSGDALSLSDVIGDDVLAQNYNAGLLNSVSVDGTVYALWGEADTFQVWYNTATYDGPTEGSYADLDAWAQTQAAKGDGVAPWCMALEAGAGSGFPAQSWITNQFLKMHGPEKLEQWATGELPWTSPEVKAAFERFGAVATSDTMVNGGPQAVVSTSIVDYSTGMFSDPQQCQLSMWGNYAAGLAQSTYPDLSVPEDMAFFPVPSDDPAYANTQLTAGHTTFALTSNDSPEVRAFLKYWASTEAQSLIAASGRWTVANTGVAMDTYPNAAMEQSAELLQGAETLAVGPETLAPSAVSIAYNEGIMAYVQDPSKLDSILATIQASQS